ANLLVRGQQAEIRIQARGARVVIAGRKVDVPAQTHLAVAAVLAPHHQRHLGVGLVADHAVNHVRANLFQPRGPIQVGFLVEARHQLDHHGDFLALARGIDQDFHQLGVGPGAVHGLLDGDHVRIVRGGADEVDHRQERLERMVQQHILLLQHFEHVPAIERRRQSRLERGKLEVRALDLVGHRAQPVEVHRAVHAVQIAFAQRELLQQEFDHALRAVIRHLQPHRVAEVAVEQLALQRGVQVLDFLFFDEQVGIARDAELVAALHVHAGEQLAHVRVQDRRQEHERVLGIAGDRLRQADHARQRARRLHDRRARVAAEGVATVGLDPAHPFPRVFNKSLNFAVELDGRDAFGRNSGAAIVQAPRALPRVIRLPQAIAGEAEYAFVFLSSILHAHMDELFSGMKVQGCYQFRVTRNSDLFVDEEEIKNLHTALQGELLHRHFGDAVRLEVADNCSEHMVEFLLQQFGLQPVDLYRVEGPVNLYRMREVPDQVQRPHLKYPPFTPGLPPALEGAELFEVLKKQDILLHHPFQSFLPVIDFIRTTANDPEVIAIKQTVYRTGTDSELMEILIDAARKGKEVTVVVELMARFDEEANLNWAARLEEVGAHVIYGVVGHKTHAKMSLI